MTETGPKARFWKLITWLLPSLLVVLAAIAWLGFEHDFQQSTLQLTADVPKGEFERGVRDYLLEQPEVIMEAVNRFEARQRTEEESAAQKVVKDRAEEIFRDPDSPVVGNPEGDVRPGLPVARTVTAHGPAASLASGTRADRPAADCRNAELN
jgi:hypothetical protein